MNELLKLIENVDHTDSDSLDEIDARLAVFVRKGDWVGEYDYHEIAESFHEEPQGTIFVYTRNPNNIFNLVKYTRSRDALKAIRPEGCYPVVSPDYDGDNFNRYVCILIKHDNSKPFEIPSLPTEELSELHAIIQAIQWSRDNEV